MVGRHKKVGIITFHRSHNCGSILQAYATQEVLKKYGYSPEFIDFSTQGQKDLYAVFKPLRFNNLQEFAKSTYRNILAVILYGRMKQNRVSYSEYIAKYLSVSEKSYAHSSELIEEELSYAKYLTGSDQVWNVSIDDYDNAYFLNFVHNHPKIAYAVSQGARNISKYAKDPIEIAKYIKDIDHVSVREENGRDWLADLTENNYPVVLDPTLLHTKENYVNIEESHDIPGVNQNNFIFVYATPLSSEFMKLIQKYAKRNGLKVVVWHSNIWFKRLGWLTGVKCPKGQNPGKYLDLIKNAKFVCTSSFHGVAFSTIYRKNFVVLENEGMRAGDDDRMTGFLKRVGLFDRIVSPAKFEVIIDKSIEYTDFEEKLAKQQIISHNFLKSALNSGDK